MEEERPNRQLHAYLSAQALEGWQRFAETQGVNLSALLEAFGQALAPLVTDQPSHPPQFLRAVVKAAQRIGSSRSSRRSR